MDKKQQKKPLQKSEKKKKTLQAKQKALITKQKRIRRKEIRESLYSFLAPNSFKLGANHIQIGGVYARTLFLSIDSPYIAQGWLSPIINLGYTIDISLFINPIPTEKMLKTLQRQLVNVEAEMMERNKKGLIRDPLLEAAYQNIEELRDKIQTAEERMFKFGLYITIYGKTLKEINDIENTINSELKSRLIYSRQALYQQRIGFDSCLPYNKNFLGITQPLNTLPVSSAFPFISFNLSGDNGILYGVNRHNSSLVIFDRFSLENANTVIIGKSGGGKSYSIKLEVLRSMMLGTSVIVIDPENEYQYLAQATGGEFFHVSLTSGDIINPFDLPEPTEDEAPADVLRGNIVTIISLLKLMLGEMKIEEESILNEAILQTYASRDITPERKSFANVDLPTMNDLQAVLEGMQGGEILAQRLQQYTTGIYSGFVNGQSNIELNKQLIVFNIRDMEDILRPIAMHLIISHIWKNVRRELKKRLLVVDEAWWMLQYPESASFLFGIVKRARKYYLGVTTITQDVNDFLKSNYGEAIITNSSLQMLMKQSPATIDQLQKTFNLTDEEKFMLLEDNVGEGLFFAGTKHVAIKVISSYVEDQIITTNPQQLLIQQEVKQKMQEQEDPMPTPPANNV